MNTQHKVINHLIRSNKIFLYGQQRITEGRINKKWTVDEIITAILQLYNEGHDVNSMAIRDFNGSLHYYALKYFRSYDNMIEACGLDSGEIRKSPKPLRKYQTQSDVINEIRNRHLQGKKINANGVASGQDKDKALQSKAVRLFGRWSVAVESAGFDYSKISPMAPPRYKSAGDIIAEIKGRHNLGLPITAVGIRNGPDRNANVYANAYKYFKDWKTALIAAGIDYGKLHPSWAKYQTKESVVEELKRRYQSGLPLNVKGIMFGENADRTLYKSGVKFYGNWLAALNSAGIKGDFVRHPRGKYPDKEAVIKAIQQHYEKSLPLLLRQIKKDDGALMNKAELYFKSWRNAVKKAGVDYRVILKQRRKYKSKDVIIEEIIRRHKTGLRINAGSLQKEDGALYCSARKEFGSWNKAVKMAKVAG